MICAQLRNSYNKMNIEKHQNSSKRSQTANFDIFIETGLDET